MRKLNQLSLGTTSTSTSLQKKKRIEQSQIVQIVVAVPLFHSMGDNRLPDGAVLARQNMSHHKKGSRWTTCAKVVCGGSKVKMEPQTRSPKH